MERQDGQLVIWIIVTFEFEMSMAHSKGYISRLLNIICALMESLMREPG